MIRPVRIDPEAEEEIGAGMLRYERARLGLGLEFLDEVDAALHSIREPGPEFRFARDADVRDRKSVV